VPASLTATTVAVWNALRNALVGTSEAIAHARLTVEMRGCEWVASSPEPLERYSA